jgi:hypothetical protein
VSADGVGLIGVSWTYLNLRLRRPLVAATAINHKSGVFENA